MFIDFNSPKTFINAADQAYFSNVVDVDTGRVLMDFADDDIACVGITEFEDKIAVEVYDDICDCLIFTLPELERLVSILKLVRT